MENDLKYFLILSIVIHFSVFLLFSVKSKKTAVIVLPVDMFFYNPPPAPVQAAVVQAAPEKEIVKKKEKDDISISKKDKKKKKEEKKKIDLKKEIKPEVKKEQIENKQEKEVKEDVKSQAISTNNENMPRAFSASNPISVDSAKFPYTYYTNTLVKKIGRSWQWSTEFGKLKTIVYFKILRTGQLDKVEIKESSGNKIFDDQALRAIKLSSPFPPLPEGYSENDLGVYFEFTYRE